MEGEFEIFLLIQRGYTKYIPSDCGKTGRPRTGALVELRPDISVMVTSSRALCGATHRSRVRKARKDIALMKNTETNGTGRGILNAMSTVVVTACLFLGAHAPVASGEIFPYENMELQVIDQDIISEHTHREMKGFTVPAYAVKQGSDSGISCTRLPGRTNDPLQIPSYIPYQRGRT